jgi:prepilin-type N-terminal cleavage/methylation domain-containing protein
VSHLLGKTIRDKSGFTLIEILMVLLLIAILTALGITQFTNFSTEAKNATVKANLKIMRNAIATQNAQMRLRCNVTSTAWPTLASIVANDITTSQCTVAQVPNPADRVFVGGGIPINSWGSTGTNTIGACSGAACTTKSLECTTAAARTGASDGWCYDVNTGQIWANSSRNDGANSNTGNEYAY